MINIINNSGYGADIKKRLARIEGQLRGIQRLMDQSADCEKVLQQMTAARKALDKAFYETMACLIERNMVDAASRSEEAMSMMMAEVHSLLAKYA